MAGVFLYAPQDFRNLCGIARTLEVLGQREVHVFDPWRLIRERYGKARSRQLRDISSGAFEKLTWVRVEEPSSFLRAFSGRVVATVAEPSATPLTKFSFGPDDLVVFGGESQGLPAEIVALAGDTVTIPSQGETQSLNLAVALGIVVFEATRQSIFEAQAQLTVGAD
jgi:tRNA (cytidine/uridine-2'-O-)-methyltransferase